MSRDKAIAKNTAFLYIRMLVTMCISFYTSRAVLQILGVADFGIYNLVGGVITSFAFISNTVTSANSRFLAFSIGKKDEQEVKKTFSVCLTSSLLIALILVILSETVGLWWFYNKLNIPLDRFDAATAVFHISVLNLFVSLIYTPFNALVIAYERMGVYAIVSVFTSVFNLGIVFFMMYSPLALDSVILYAFLLLLVNIGLGLFYFLYSRRHFGQISLRMNFSRDLKSLFSYSSWDLYGNLAVTARTSGVAILQNMFFGVGINAAIGIATQVQGIVNQFSSNILFASKPQIVKSYAAGDIQDMLNLIFKTTKYSTLLLSFMMIPLIIEMDFVLTFWLGILPDYTSSFVKWFLFFIVAANVSQCLLMGIHATGKVRKSSLINGSLYLLVLPIAFLAFKEDFNPVFPYILNVVFVVLGGFFNAIYLKKEVPSFRIFKFYSHTVLPVLTISLTNYFILFFLKDYFVNPYSQFLLVGLISVTIMIVLSWLFVVDEDVKPLILNKMRERGLWWKS